MIWAIAVISGFILFLHVCGLMICLGEKMATGTIKESSDSARGCCQFIIFAAFLFVFILATCHLILA